MNKHMFHHKKKHNDYAYKLTHVHIYTHIYTHSRTPNKDSSGRQAFFISNHV